jgi:hypothetical protein
VDEDEINQLLEDALAPLVSELRKEFKSSASKEGKEGSDDPIETQLAALQAELKKERDTRIAAEKAQQQSRLDNAILGLAGDKKLVQPSVFKKLLQAEMGDSFVESDSQWFVKGKIEGESPRTLQAAVDEYLGSDAGKLFMPPSGTAGSGTKETKPTAAGTSQKLSDADFAAAFGL